METKLNSLNLTFLVKSIPTSVDKIEIEEAIADSTQLFKTEIVSKSKFLNESIKKKHFSDDLCLYKMEFALLNPERN